LSRNYTAANYLFNSDQSENGPSQTGEVDEFGCHKEYDGVVKGASILDECSQGDHTCTSEHASCLDIVSGLVVTHFDFFQKIIIQLYQRSPIILHNVPF